jgi:hypothetical protein
VNQACYHSLLACQASALKAGTARVTHACLPSILSRHLVQGLCKAETLTPARLPSHRAPDTSASALDRSTATVSQRRAAGVSALFRCFSTERLTWAAGVFALRPAAVSDGHILHTSVGSGPLIWLFSPAWDAGKLTMPGGLLHLCFRGHRQLPIKSDDAAVNDGGCCRTNV